MSESEVGKLAVSIEKEMFNIYMNTDNKYKNKYRSLMFNLKDPKNKVSHFICMFIFLRKFLRKLYYFTYLWQGLFYRVVDGEISPFRLVRLSPEELLSKEMSDWRKSEISEVKQVGICFCTLYNCTVCLNYVLIPEESGCEWEIPIRTAQKWIQTGVCSPRCGHGGGSSSYV